MLFVVGGLGVSIKYGGGIVDARGSLAGNTFSRNANGAYMRAKVAGTNPRTPSQTQQRNFFGAISAAYKDLTADQVAAWTEAAKGSLGAYTNRLGEASQYTANQLYMKLNTVLSSIGADTLDNPPATWEHYTISGELGPWNISEEAFIPNLVMPSVSEAGFSIYLSRPVTPSKHAMSTVPMTRVSAGTFTAAALAEQLTLAFVDQAWAADESYVGTEVHMRVVLTDVEAGTQGPERTFVVPIITTP